MFILLTIHKELLMYKIYIHPVWTMLIIPLGLSSCHTSMQKRLQNGLWKNGSLTISNHKYLDRKLIYWKSFDEWWKIQYFSPCWFNNPSLNISQIFLTLDELDFNLSDSVYTPEANLLNMYYNRRWHLSDMVYRENPNKVLSYLYTVLTHWFCSTSIET